MENIKNSASHLLRINEVDVPGCRGQVGMTFCPGKKQFNAASGTWGSDLDSDLLAIKSWGASILITLMEEKEFSEFKVQDLPKHAKEMDFEWIHLPIEDVSVPSRQVNMNTISLDSLNAMYQKAEQYHVMMGTLATQFKDELLFSRCQDPDYLQPTPLMLRESVDRACGWN